MFTTFRQQSFDGGVIVEARYHGPFNALLNYCFPETSQFRFIVTPQRPPSLEQPRDSVDVAVYYLVIYNSALRPVLFVAGGCGGGKEGSAVTLDDWKQSSGACWGSHGSGGQRCADLRVGMTWTTSQRKNQHAATLTGRRLPPTCPLMPYESKQFSNLFRPIPPHLPGVVLMALSVVITFSSRLTLQD